MRVAGGKFIGVVAWNTPEMARSHGRWWEDEAVAESSDDGE